MLIILPKVNKSVTAGCDKFPTILDLTRAQTVLGYETLGVEEQLKQIGTEREKSLERNGELQTAHANGETQNGSYWDTSLLKSNRDNNKFFLKQETIDRLKNDESNPGKLMVDPNAKLEEELIVRPTSEAIIWNTYKGWIQL